MFGINREDDVINMANILEDKKIHKEIYKQAYFRVEIPIWEQIIRRCGMALSGQIHYEILHEMTVETVKRGEIVRLVSRMAANSICSRVSELIGRPQS